jgi:hypothetical protein
LGSDLGIGAFLLKICAQLSGVPIAVWRSNLAFPVFLDDVLEIVAICRRWIWNVIIREPPLKLGLMPFVIN